MPILKGGLTITVAAGVMAAGVTYYAQKQPRPQPASVTVSPPAASGTAPEVSEAKERLRKSLTAAYGSPPAAPVPAAQPVPVAVPPPVEALAAARPAPEAKPSTPPVDTRTADAGPAETKPAEAPRQVASVDANAGTKPATDTAWVSKPQPELVAKADAAFDTGDIAGARLWLEAALAEGDADAAYRLAETYDPAVLTEWKVIGIASDVSKAKALYERAMRGGVEAARERVARLAD